MTYSLTRFSVYEEAKKSIAPGEKNPNGLKLAICGSIGVLNNTVSCWFKSDDPFDP